MPELERIVLSLFRESRESQAPGVLSTYGCRIQGLADREIEVSGLEFHEGVSVPKIGRTLGELEEQIFPATAEQARREFKTFDVRTRLDLGNFLFDRLFGQLAPTDLQNLLKSQGLELRIGSDDEDLIRLPWVALASAQKAHGKKWSVSLAAETAAIENVSVPPLPRVLLVLPEPADRTRFPKTDSDDHEKLLRALVEKKADPAYRLDEYWRTVKTWPDFQQAIGQEGEFDVVYFYGHGRGDLRHSRLVFQDGEGVELETVAAKLRDAPGRRARLVYLNCCSGDAGGFLGAGCQLRGQVPAVFTNRTFVRVPRAQRNGRVFFEEIFLNRVAPHVAYRELCAESKESEDPGQSSRELDALTPVLHARYDRWEPPQVLKLADALKNPDLRYFDRATPKGLLDSFLPVVLKRRGGLAVLWFGEAGYGTAAFHEHLRQLLASFANLVNVGNFGWPPDAAAPGYDSLDESLRDQLAASFGRPEVLAQGMRARFVPDDKRSVTCYLQVSFPVKAGQPMELENIMKLLRRFMEIFDRHFAPHFEPPFVPVLGLAVEVENAAAFKAGLAKWQEKLRLANLQPKVLPPFDKVAEEEVKNHLEVLEVGQQLHPGELERMAALILKQTGGRYWDVVRLLDNEIKLDRLAEEVREP